MGWYAGHKSKITTCQCGHVSLGHAPAGACRVCSCAGFQAWTSKYKAERQEYNGRWFDSKAEAHYAAELDLRLKAKDLKSFECQVQIPLYVYGVLISTYIADFKLTNLNDSLEIHEVKGFFTEYSRLKWKLFNAIYAKEYPDIKITMVRV